MLLLCSFEIPLTIVTSLSGLLKMAERYMKSQVSKACMQNCIQSKKSPNCCQSMQSLQECCMGPSLSKQREYSQPLFPLCYHIRTSLVGKFLIYAVIFLAGTGKALISRCCCTPSISLSAALVQQSISTQSKQR